MTEEYRPQFVFYGHHKCASSSINRFLWRATAALGMTFESFNSDEQAGGNVASGAKSKNLEVVSLRNCRWDHALSFPDVPGVHCIRDPRDVLVSGYFSHLKTHRLIEEEMVKERERLQGMSKEEGLLEAMKGITGRTITEMGDWNYGEAPGVLELSLERLSKDWIGGLRQIVEQAGWLKDFQSRNNDSALLVQMLNFNKFTHRYFGRRVLRRSSLRDGEFIRLADQVSFSSLSGGRKPGETDSTSHYRRGQHGDWVNHFTPKLEEAFKELFPNVVTKLGYAPSEDWTAETFSPIS